MADLSLSKKEHLNIKKTITVASGTGSTTFILNKPISHLLIEAPNTTDTFIARIKDAEGDYHTKTLKCYDNDSGLLSTIWEKDLPTIGTMTIELSSASSDGGYKITILYPNT